MINYRNLNQPTGNPDGTFTYQPNPFANCCGPNAVGGPQCAIVSCAGFTGWPPPQPNAGTDVKTEAYKQKQWIFIIAALVVAYFLFKK